METDSSDKSSSKLNLLENADTESNCATEKSQSGETSSRSQSPSISSPKVLITPDKLGKQSKSQSLRREISHSSVSSFQSISSTGSRSKLKIRARPWSSGSRSQGSKNNTLKVSSDGKVNVRAIRPPQSASWSSTEEKKRRLFSMKGKSSGRMSPTTTQLSPLYSANIRLERSFRFGSSQCISPEDQLRSCFPDRNIRLYVLIWNMQEMKDLPSSLQDLLLPPEDVMASDMFIIGTVESTPAKQEWEILVQKTLGPSYVLVQSAAFGVLYLLFFIRRDLIWFCSAVEVSWFATRPLVTAIKTKGAVAISFSLFGSTFLFIVSHFTADREYVAERNTNMKRTAANLSFNRISAVEGPDVTAKFDYVFWCGDFNYRIDMDRKTVDKILSSPKEVAIRNLLMEDQLTKEMLQGNVFEGFSEQPIKFLPTYKYDIGTDKFDSSDKQRTPSWTDRVLFRSKTNDGIWGLRYFSYMDMKCSDHKPVGAIFRVKLAPSTHMESIPDTVASFNTAVYEKAIRERKILSKQLSSPDNTTDGPVSTTTPRRPTRTKTISQYCIVL